MSTENILKADFLANIHRLHTTPMGISRIKRNLDLTEALSNHYCQGNTALCVSMIENRMLIPYGR